MFHTENKLKARINELEPYRYLNRKAIEGWKVKADISKEEKYPPKVDESWSDFPVGSNWEGRDYYLWLVTELQIPVLKEEEDFVLLFYFGKTGPGYCSGFESMIFINDEPYQGVDSNHCEVFIGATYSGQTVRLALKLWSGLEGGGPQQVMYHKFLYADHSMLSPTVDDLYYTSKVMLDTVLLLDSNDPRRFKMLNALERAYEKVDWSEPGGEHFYGSLEEANLLLNGELLGMTKDTPITITAVGHTHIDVAWLWQLKHTREKSARSFSTVLRLMERYPEYIFLQSQPQLYAYIKEDYPEIYEKIKEKIAEGTWEVDGAMWVEADCNISSGESLVRQILHGSRFIKQEFGKETKYLWLPDVFGYSWALPQILKKSGIETFMTTKISWNQYNRLPHDTFIWRGIDGSEVLAHFITTPDAGIDLEYFSYYTYNGVLEPSTVRGIYDQYRDKDINDELLLCYGYGDGGGGVNREMLEKRKRLDRMPGLPHVKTGRAKEYFERLHETVKGTKNYVHTWDGELYLEYHRGTYTSQAFVKKWNRKLELAYRRAELLHTLASVRKENWAYPAEKIVKGWEIILRNQFHDIIPGSSIKEVYQDNVVEYQEAKDLALEMENNFANLYLERKDNQWSIFNDAGWSSSELVFIPLTEDGVFEDSKGQTIPSEKISDGYLVECLEVAALSSKVITFVPEKEGSSAGNCSGKNTSDSSFTISEHDIETPYYRIAWNDEGHLTSIVDRENQRQVLKEGGLGNYLRIFEDKPMQYDAWDIDLYYVLKSKTLTANKIEILSKTALYASVGFYYEFGKSTIIQEMRVYTGSRRIDFKTKVNWQERQQLLRTSFDVNIRGTEAVYDIQYGNVKRSTHWNTSWDMARFESVGHQWVDFAQREYGVALLNDSKYGYSVKDHTMSLSLLKGAIYPDPDADLGEHEFTYSLLPHKGDFVEGNVTQEAWSLNSPMVALKGETREETFIQVNSEEPVVIDAIKLREDGGGVILRYHDHTGSNREFTLEPEFDFKCWQETSLMEEPIGEEIFNEDGSIRLTLAPYEIKTIVIR